MTSVAITAIRAVLPQLNDQDCLKLLWLCHNDADKAINRFIESKGRILSSAPVKQFPATLLHPPANPVLGSTFKTKNDTEFAKPPARPSSSSAANPSSSKQVPTPKSSTPAPPKTAWDGLGDTLAHVEPPKKLPPIPKRKISQTNIEAAAIKLPKPSIIDIDESSNDCVVEDVLEIDTQPLHTEDSDFDEPPKKRVKPSDSAPKALSTTMNGGSAKFPVLKKEVVLKPNSESRPKLLCDVVVQAYSTTRGKNLLKAGDEIILDRQSSTPNASSSSAPAVAGKKKNATAIAKSAMASNQITVGSKDYIVVRFRRKSDRMEMGRLPTEVSKWLCILLDADYISVTGSCIDCPSSLSMITEIVLNLSVSLNEKAFLANTSEMDGEVAKLRRNAFMALLDSGNVKLTRKGEGMPDSFAPMIQNLTSTSVKDEPNTTGNDNEEERDVVDEFQLQKLYERARSEDANLSELEPSTDKVKSTLRSYQKQALFWMASRESTEENSVGGKADALHPLWCEFAFAEELDGVFYFNMLEGQLSTQFPSATNMTTGGILADEMGLGKTLEMLSLIMMKQAPASLLLRRNVDGVYKSRATLIVCPMSLASQWRDQAIDHCHLTESDIFIYYGSEKNQLDLSTLASKYLLIITTYGTVTAEFQSKKGNLYLIDFYRIILDEAHIIKNRITKVSKACSELIGQRRWCVTGTPIENRLEDMFSLLQFIHAEPWSSYSFWRAMIGRPFEEKDPRALDVLQTVVKPLMLRRTKDTRDKNGEPILTLPPVDNQVVYLTLSTAERDFYDALFKGTKTKFNEFCAKGSVLSNYASILELLLRLRQACDHPFLLSSASIESVGLDLETLMANFMTDMPEEGRTYAQNVVNQIKSNQQHHDTDTINVDSNLNDEDVISTIAECPICLDKPENPVISSCFHSGCRACLIPIVEQLGTCPVCQHPLTIDDFAKLTKSNARPNQPADEDSRDGATGGMMDVVTDDNWRTSTKLEVLVYDLLQLRKQDEANGAPPTKVVVFSQFTSMLNLVQIVLKKNDIKFVRMDGTLTQSARETVISKFKDDPEYTVFLVSLRTGGVGLNLTCATVVYLLDIWWNPAVEDQAVNRVHRIGQTKPVTIRRFIVKNSVEEQLLALQKKKEMLARHALHHHGDEDDEKQQRLEDLKMLFS